MLDSDSPSPTRRRPTQKKTQKDKAFVKANSRQLAILNAAFEKSRSLDLCAYTELCELTGLGRKWIASWFCRQRTRFRKMGDTASLFSNQDLENIRKTVEERPAKRRKTDRGSSQARSTDDDSSGSLSSEGLHMLSNSPSSEQNEISRSRSSSIRSVNSPMVSPQVDADHPPKLGTSLLGNQKQAGSAISSSWYSSPAHSGSISPSVECLSPHEYFSMFASPVATLLRPSGDSSLAPPLLTTGPSVNHSKSGSLTNQHFRPTLVDSHCSPFPNFSCGSPSPVSTKRLMSTGSLKSLMYRSNLLQVTNIPLVDVEPTPPIQRHTQVFPLAAPMPRPLRRAIAEELNRLVDSDVNLSKCLAEPGKGNVNDFDDLSMLDWDSLGNLSPTLIAEAEAILKADPIAISFVDRDPRIEGITSNDGTHTQVVDAPLTDGSNTGNTSSVNQFTQNLAEELHMSPADLANGDASDSISSAKARPIPTVINLSVATSTTSPQKALQIESGETDLGDCFKPGSTDTTGLVIHSVGGEANIEDVIDGSMDCFEILGENGDYGKRDLFSLGDALWDPRTYQENPTQVAMGLDFLSQLGL